MENKRRTPPQQTRGRSRGQPPRRRTAPGQSTRPVDHRQPAQQNSGVRSRQRPPAQRSSAPSRPHPPAQRSPAPSRPRPPAKDPPPRRRRPSVGSGRTPEAPSPADEAVLPDSVFFLVIGTALTFAFTVLFRVETVEVRGESRYSAEEILKASGLQTGGNVFLTGYRGSLRRGGKGSSLYWCGGCPAYPSLRIGDCGGGGAGGRSGT